MLKGPFKSVHMSQYETKKNLSDMFLLCFVINLWEVRAAVVNTCPVSILITLR